MYIICQRKSSQFQIYCTISILFCNQTVQNTLLDQTDNDDEGSTLFRNVHNTLPFTITSSRTILKPSLTSISQTQIQQSNSCSASHKHRTLSSFSSTSAALIFLSLLLLLLSSSSSSSSSPLCRVFILRQTMSLGNTVLQLFCCYYLLLLLMSYRMIR